MKRKNIILIIVILLLLLVGGYLGYKIYYVNYYDLSHIQDLEKSKENFVINDEILITTNKLSDEEYFIYENIKLKNIFNNFEIKHSSDYIPNIQNEKFVWYYLNNSNNTETIAALGIAIGKTLIDEYSNNDWISSDDRVGPSGNFKKFFEDNNIKTDIELLKHIERTKNHKNSIFDSVKKMNMNYDLHSLVRSRYIRTEGISLIKGDYEGYVINHNMDDSFIKEYNIIKNNARYTLTFVGLDYFTDEKIQDLLNTLVIE